MPDSATKAVQQAIDGNLIPFTGTAILFIAGALYAVYKWTFKRQLKRLDENIELTESHDKQLGILNMQMELTLESIKEQSMDNKESIKAVYAKIDADNLRHEKQIDRFEDYFKQFLELKRKEDGL